MAIRVTVHASPLLLQRGVRGVTGQPMEIVVHFPTSPALSARGFASDSAFPDPELVARLPELARRAGERPEARLLLFGHADESGGDQHNKGLSDRRAKAVLALLTQDLNQLDVVAREDGWVLRQYQAMMAALGIAPMEVDGQPGIKTTHGVKTFQHIYNSGQYHERALRTRAHEALQVDGELGPRTEAALRDAYLALVQVKLDSARFFGPKTAGCGAFNRIGEPASDRRVVLALYRPDFPTESKIPCKKGDAGACKIDKKAKHPWKCNFYRRTLEPEQQISATSLPTPASRQPLRVQDPAGRPLAATDVVIHCAGRTEQFTTDPEGLVDHTAFTQGAPFSLELPGFAALAMAGADGSQGQQDEPGYDPGPICTDEWCCDEHEALA